MRRVPRHKRLETAQEASERVEKEQAAMRLERSESMNDYFRELSLVNQQKILDYLEAKYGKEEEA